MEIKRAVIEKADKVIMLLDSSKVGKNMPFTFAELSNINYLVVDGNFPQVIKSKIENSGTIVI
jgi:DeoR/GlpR family transcriptional regulator of sugar metabolism